MKTGTKSILFGVHCFLLHPVFVAIAWIKLYGFPWDPRIWIAFFVHDLGYIGKLDIDGVQGETHVELGAKIMHLFDGYDHKRIPYEIHNKIMSSYIEELRSNGWKVTSGRSYGYKYFEVLLRKRRTAWHDFALYHSRYYARANFKPYSKLCVADKLAFVITPRWLYIPLATASGEIREYIQRAMGHLSEAFYDSYLKFHPGIKRSWLVLAKMQTQNWILEHKNGEPDVTTPVNRYFAEDIYNPSRQRYIVSADPCSENACEWNQSIEIHPINGNPVKSNLSKN